VRAHQAELSPLQLLNAPTKERDLTRLTLLPGLLDAVARNLKHTNERVAFFEIAMTYFSRGDAELPYERRTLAIALSGSRKPRTWLEPTPGPYSYYDLKGMLAGVLKDLNISDWSTKPRQHPALHSGRSASLTAGGQEVGYLGELHPEVAAAFEIEGWPTVVAEIDLDALYGHSSDERSFEALPRYPSAYRDLAVVVGQDTPAAEIVRLVHEAGGLLVASARIFDVYSGGQTLPVGKKSVAVELELRAPDATLAQEQISEVIGKIVDALSRTLMAVLRE
jgi:phenylalanyl-tRNA synthetase beta chain